MRYFPILLKSNKLHIHIAAHVCVPQDCAEVLDKMLSHPGVDMNVVFKCLDDQLDLLLCDSKEIKSETVSAFSLESAANCDDDASSINTSRSLFGQQVGRIVWCPVCICSQLT